MTHSDTALGPKLRMLIVAVLLGGIMAILDGTMIAVAVETLGREFQTGLATVGWVSTGYLLALVVTIPVTAWAVSRFGARRMWFVGLAVFLLASLACALAWNFPSLLIFRILQGVGAGIVDPLVLILLARAAGPARAGRVMGLMGVVLSLGPVLGPVLGGLVLDSAGWRALFFINIPIGAVAAVLSWRLIQRDAPADLGSAGRLDLVGVLLLVPGLAGVMLGFTQIGETNTVVAWQVLVPLVLGAALLGGYVLHALHAQRVMPLIDLRMFATTGFAPSVVVQGLVGTGTFSVLFALPLYYQLLHGFSPSTAGLLVAPLGAGAALAMPIAGRLSDRLGAKRLVQGGGTLALLATLALTQIGGGPGIGTAIAAGVAASAVGVGLGFVGAPTIGALYRILPPQQVPQGSSVLYTLNQLGAGIGIATVAVLVSTAGANDPLNGLHALYWFAFAAIVTILICSPRLPGRPTPANERSAETASGPAS